MPSPNFIDRLNNWIKSSVTLKLFFIGFLVLVLMIPSSMVQEVINERSFRKQEAIGEVSSTWGGAQTIAGPVLTVPYKYTWTDKDDKQHYHIKYAHFLPKELNIENQVDPVVRNRGIYEIPLFNTKTKVHGNFDQPDFTVWRNGAQSRI